MTPDDQHKHGKVGVSRRESYVETRKPAVREKQAFAGVDMFSREAQNAESAPLVSLAHMSARACLCVCFCISIYRAHQLTSYRSLIRTR